MVSIFSGEVNRTWRFCDGGGQHHEVSLYHHPLTGARAALVDHEELEGSLGTSSVFHGSTTTIPFACGGCRGAIHIQRSAFFGFSYACSADGVSVPEATSATADPRRAPGRAGGRSGPALTVNSCRVLAHVTTRDHASPSAPIVWYLIETHASKGDEVATTRVHRRFRDFADLDEAVNGALAGHHVRSSVPRLPQKKLKLLQDHNDQTFLDARRRDLDGYVAKLVHVPHVWATPPAAPFVGVADNVREYSVVFPERTLGFTLGKSSGAESRENDFPAFVASCRPPDCPVDVRIGDLLSKISGRSVATMTFAECVNAIKHSQRPIMLHFLATLGSVPSDPLLRAPGGQAPGGLAPATPDPFAGDFDDNPFAGSL